MKAITVLALAASILLPGIVVAAAKGSAVRTPQVAPAPEEPSKQVAQEAPALPAPSYQVRMTAYNAVPGQTDSTPFITASGMRTNTDTTAARSRDLDEELPFGTVIRIDRKVADTPSCRFSEVAPQIGYRVITDTMHPRWTSKIDVLLDHKATLPVHGVHMNPARVLGVCGEVTVTVVGKMDLKAVPATQAELAVLFEGAPDLASESKELATVKD